MENLRCINIDWLEVYVSESPSRFPCNAEYYRSHGYRVIERAYGTRQYREMFTILDDTSRPFIEVRRCPVSGDDARNVNGIFSPFSSHIRLHNRYCYAPNAVQLLTDFLMANEYAVSRLYRLDLCMDFEKFDDGTDPQKVVDRYLKGRYVKINQANITAHGADHWDSRAWNSLSWGQPKSMVSTKMYDKTMELRQAKDKPYIRYAWFCAGLVDDFFTLERVRPDGSRYNPRIWRVEFSIRSVARGWYIVEDSNGRKTRTLAQEHTLATYATKDGQLKAFASLAHHYFHFKVYEDGVRKDRLKDKMLFDFKNHSVYKLDRLLSDVPSEDALTALRRRLLTFRSQHPMPEVCRACDSLLEQIDLLVARGVLADPYNTSEARLLQLLISRRIANHDEPLEDSLADIRSILALPDLIF